jgi:hypothetical protein
MTRGRATNAAFIYPHITGEADHQHTTPKTTPDIHTLRRGNAYSAAHHFRQILAHDDRPRTMHDEAERTPRHELPDTIADILQRNQYRRTTRRTIWLEQTRRTRWFQAGYERAASRSIGNQRDGDCQINGGSDLGIC